MKVLIAMVALLIGSVAGQASEEISSATYGVQARYTGRILKYTDFLVRFLKRVEHHEKNWGYITFHFEVLRRDGVKSRDFQFTRSGSYLSSQAIDIEGVRFVAEMFSTTVTDPASPDALPLSGRRIPDDEIVFWDEATARRGNPKLLEHWQKEEADQSPEPVPLKAKPEGRVVGCGDRPFHDGNFTASI